VVVLQKKGVRFLDVLNAKTPPIIANTAIADKMNLALNIMKCLYGSKG
jgi:hypothetical protein